MSGARGVRSIATARAMTDKVFVCEAVVAGAKPLVAR